MTFHSFGRSSLVSGFAFTRVRGLVVCWLMQQE
jgi:hypothetical protein